jgi:signal transduction histidine kinase
LTAHQRRISVLLLEDDDLDAELLQAQLSADGVPADIRRARTSEEYLQALSEPGIDVVLSDFSLPGYDGMAALEAARERISEVPFIFVSGAIGEERAIDTLQRGATDYVLKHRLGRLSTAVSRALGLAEERSRRRAAEAERDRLLQSEQAAREAAEAANRMKDEFLAVASHELRTPLSSILGWATLLTTDQPNAELVAKGLGIIKRNAQAQARLIEDILDISRIVTGKLQLRTESLTVASFVLPAVESVRPAAAAKSILLTVDVQAAEIVEGDGGRLQQVMWNLVANAVKFTPHGGSVSVRAWHDEQQVLVSVEDSGQGIEPDFLPHVFERFRQADPSASRRAGGLGLGLSIVRYLVEAHGGSVRAESAGRGQGCKFLVKLPRRPEGPQPSEPEKDPDSSPEIQRDSLTGLPPLDGVRILVVEDDHDGRELVALILRDRGAQVITAASAQQALQLLEQEAPDVLVSDIGMPDMDGYAFIRHVRARPASAGGGTPAIALTAYTRELDRRQAEAAGFHHHLAKPVTPGALLRTIGEVLARTGRPAVK